MKRLWPLAAALGVALAVIVTAGGQNNGSTVRAATVSGYMSGIVTVSWAPVSGAADYALYRDSTRVATAGPSATSTRFSVAAGTHTLSVVAEFAVATTTAPTTTPAGGCTKTLAAGGNIRTFIQSLSAGQTGCLSPGTYNQSVTLYNGDSHGTTTAPVTLTSADPSNPATIFGRFVTETGADNLTFSYLKFNWNAGQSVAPSVTVGSNNVTFNHDDVTNGNTSICFDLINDATYGVANNTVIENSTVHGCGLIPATNGDHGIYVSGNNDQIHDNWIYNNADRGVQLRGAMGAVVEHNVIDGNGEGVIFGDLNASNNTVAYNTIANSNVRWNAEVSLPGTGNSFHDNCTWATNTNSYYDSAGGVSLPGIAVANNIIGNPGYAGNGNYTLPSGSPCAGDGPSGTPGVGSAPPPPPPPTTTTAPPPPPPTTTAPTTTSAPPPASVLSVSPTGSDSCTRGGTVPCRTWQEAYNLAQPGDNITVLPGAYPPDYPSEGALKIQPAAKSSATPVAFVCGGGTVTFASPADQLVITAQHVAIQGSCFHLNRLWVGDGSNGVPTNDVTVDGVSMWSFNIAGSSNVTISNSTIGPDVACYAPGQAASCQNNTADNEAYWYQSGRGNTDFVEPMIHTINSTNPVNVQLLNDQFVQLQTRDSTNMHMSCLWLGWSPGGSVTIKGSTFTGCATDDIHVDVPGSWNLTLDGNTFHHSVEPLETGNVWDTETNVAQTELQVKCQTNEQVDNYTITNNVFEHGWDLDFGGCTGATYPNLVLSGNTGGTIRTPAQ